MEMWSEQISAGRHASARGVNVSARGLSLPTAPAVRVMVGKVYREAASQPFRPPGHTFHRTSNHRSPPLGAGLKPQRSPNPKSRDHFSDWGGIDSDDRGSRANRPPKRCCDKTPRRLP